MLSRARTAIWDIYLYREVLANILSRDLKLKYKHTFFGYFWSLLNPIFQLAVMAFVFSHVVKWNVRDYTLYLFSGMVVWTFFNTTLIVAAFSYLESESFIRKVYLPKVLFPLSKLCFRAVDFLFSLVALLLLGLMLGYGLKATMALLPAAIVLLFAFTLGVSLIVAVLTVYFRDTQYLMQVFLQMLYFATPIIYPLSSIPENYRWVLEVNPFYTQVRLFQALIYEGALPSAAEWCTAGAVALGTLALGFAVLLFTEDELVFRL